MERYGLGSLARLGELPLTESSVSIMRGVPSSKASLQGQTGRCGLQISKAPLVSGEASSSPSSALRSTPTLLRMETSDLRTISTSVWPMAFPLTATGA